MDGCPSRERLAAWVEEGEAKSPLREHVSTCAPCSTVCEGLREDRRLFDRLRLAYRRSESPASFEWPDFEGFDIEGEIHRGGQGVIYRAKQTGTDRSVALKILKRRGEASSREVARFEREIELAAKLKHPNIVTLHHSGLAGSDRFFCMELVDGVRLDAWLAQRRRTRDDVLTLFVKIASAVAYAHSRDVIHRDLKPHNILIDEEGEPHVLDFGLAKSVDPTLASSLSRTGEFLGTLAYASPEQVRSDGQEIDHRSDIYSLGVLLYEMLTGALPIEVDGPIATVLRRIEEQPPRVPKELGADVDPALELSVLKALAKEPARRYESISHWLEDIERYRSGRPLHAKPEGRLYRVGRFIRKRKFFVLCACVLAVVVVGAVWIAVDSRWRMERQRASFDQVRTVFEEILAAASPQRMGGEVTLLEVIESASSTLEASLPDVPVVRAAAHFTIADTYFRLFRVDDAEPHARAAVKLFEEALGQEHVEVAKGLDLLGRILSDNSRDEGIAVQERALRLRQNALEEDDPRIGASLRHLGWALQRSFYGLDLDRAERLYVQSLKGSRGRDGQELETARTLHLLATLRATRKQTSGPEGAEALFLEALDIFEQRRGESESLAVPCSLDYASFLIREGRLDEGEQRLREGIERTNRVFGPQRVNTVLWSLAELHEGRDELQAAGRLYRQCLANRVSGWALEHPGDDKLRALSGELGAFESPWPDLAKVYGALIRVSVPGSFELASEMDDLARWSRASGQDGQAERLLRLATTIECRIFGGDCTVTVSCEYSLGVLLNDQGRWGEALPFLEKALATLNRVGRGGGERTTSLRLATAAARAKHGRFGDAVDVLRPCLEGPEGLSGVSKDVWEALIRYGEKGGAGDEGELSQWRDWLRRLGS